MRRGRYRRIQGLDRSLGPLARVPMEMTGMSECPSYELCRQNLSSTAVIIKKATVVNKVYRGNKVCLIGSLGVSQRPVGSLNYRECFES
jgi:hypothetical protein